MRIAQWLSYSVDWLLPNHCFLCASPCAETLCSACWSDLPHPLNTCPRCALPQHSSTLCGECQQKTPSFDRTISAFSYEGLIPQLINQFKHRGHRRLGRALSHALGQNLQAMGHKPDLLIAVPLHWRNQLRRGFNQADIIAGALSTQLVLPRAYSLRRQPTAQHQQQLSRQQRQTNIRQRFSSNRRFKGEHLGLVDDVMTTGSTVEEISRLLKCEGAAEVSVLVLARTPKQRSG